MAWRAHRDSFNKDEWIIKEDSQQPWDWGQIIFVLVILGLIGWGFFHFIGGAFFSFR